MKTEIISSNNAKVKALKKISETKWVGNTIHDSMEKCLVGLNLDSTNSGAYLPSAVKINGVTGFFMTNEDGSLFCEARVIKEDNNKFRIEYLTTSGWNEFEKLYYTFLNA